MIKINYHILDIPENEVHPREGPSYKYIENGLNIVKNQLEKYNMARPRLISYSTQNNYEKSTVRKALVSTWEL